LFCYPSQLSPNSEGTWKFNKAYELTKKGGSNLCLNALKETKEFGKLKNIPWHGFLIFKEGNSDVEIFADIFLKELVSKLTFG